MGLKENLDKVGIRTRILYLTFSKNYFHPVLFWAREEEADHFPSGKEQSNHKIVPFYLKSLFTQRMRYV